MQDHGAVTIDNLSKSVSVTYLLEAHIPIKIIVNHTKNRTPSHMLSNNGTHCCAVRVSR